MGLAGLTRRDLLRRGGAIALTATGWQLMGGRPGSWGTPPASAATLPLFSMPLRFPRTLRASDIRLRMRPADVPIFPGATPTRMWTFAGEFPGPIIRRPAGATTRVTFEHALPATAGTLTIHHHGHHNAAGEDGQPDSQLIAPGGARTYTYTHVEEGRPLRGALRFVHDHSHGRTGRNAWMGLLAMFIVDDGVDRSLRLPTGAFDLPLLIAERSFDAGNQLTDPFTNAPAPPNDDAVGVGDRMLVNGVPEPYHQVAGRRYRLRVLNASSFHPLNLSFDAGLELIVVGTESGLLPAPVRTQSVLLGPAERAEIIVDFSGVAGRSVVLQSTPVSGVLPATAAASAPVMQFRVGDVAPDRSSVPEQLRPLPAWTSSARLTPDRVFAFGLGADSSGGTAWTINGRTYDPARIDAKPELGSTETWLLVNTYTTSHYVHIHDVDWLVLARNGQPPSGPETGLKETFRLDPGETLLIAAKFTDHLGPFMVHCHMLNHEDHAMMTRFEVVPPGQGDRLGLLGPGAPARFAGQTVRVPLGRVQPQEAGRVAGILAAQRRLPGRPARPPSTPLRLAGAEVARAFECHLTPIA